MKFLTCAAMAALVLVAPLQARSQDADAGIRRRIEKELAEELARLRASLAEKVRLELAGGSGKIGAALGLITEEDLKKHATYLASDELKGRQAGYEGNDKAAEYIAGVMKRAGLAPVGDKDDKGNATYFQAFKAFKRPTRNCLAMLEGSDPELKKEIIVVGAHFDHVGSGDTEGPPFQRMGRPRDGDDIWNGADDNGSGTSTLLGMIRAFGEGGLKPKRSILFIAFTGEEGGLLGSYHYVAHPIAPMARHTFMLNLDMVGRNPDKPIKIEGVGSAEGTRLRKAVEDAVALSGLKAIVNDQVTLQGGDSDHTPFHEKGVPFTFFFSGFHADYHRVTDHAEKLAYDNMVKVGRASARILMTLADADETLAARKLEFDAPAPARPRRTLGVVITDLSDGDRETLGLKEGEAGVRVDKVNDDSVALAAGVEPGDVVLRINDKGLSPGTEFDDLRKILNDVTAGKDVPVVVLRKGKRVTLTARWEK